jgi:hypothetical protein
MPVASDSHLLTLSNTQAKHLAGSLVTIGGERYCFKNYDAGQPGQPPWRSGAEGKAYPLLGMDGAIAAYLKFFTRPTQKRLARTAWLIGRGMHTWLPGLVAAPLLWADTRHARRPSESRLDFAGYLARAVPGETWLELKTSINDAKLSFHDERRWQCLRDLVLALAVLEREGIVHGDLSPNNIVIDPQARGVETALYLIDFDAFVAPALGANRAVAVAEGGTYGTEGYCPPDLATRAMAGDGAAAPYSDRYGRDMLLVELLLLDRGLSADDPPSLWNRDQLERRYAAWRARCDPASAQALAHLDPATVFSLAEQDRPTSAELAAGLGLSLPTRRSLDALWRICRPAPALLSQRAGKARMSGPRWRPLSTPQRPTPALLHHLSPRRWSRPESDPFYRTFMQDLTSAMIGLVILCLPLLLPVVAAIVALIVRLFTRA